MYSPRNTNALVSRWKVDGADQVNKVRAVTNPELAAFTDYDYEGV